MSAEMIQAAAISPDLREKRLATAQKWLRFLLRIRWAVAAATFLIAIVGNGLILQEMNQLPSWLSTTYFYYPDNDESGHLSRINLDEATRNGWYRCVAEDAPSEWVTLPIAPSFILVGAHDEGTLELASKLKDHPLVRSATRSLTSFYYDSLEEDSVDAMYSDYAMCRLRRNYAAQFGLDARLQLRMKQPRIIIDPDSSLSVLGRGKNIAFEKALDGISNVMTSGRASNVVPSSVIFDSSDYLTMFSLPPQTRELCPWAKIVINVGHPGDRLWWYFKSFILNPHGLGWSPGLARNKPRLPGMKWAVGLTVSLLHMSIRRWSISGDET
jgi:hypothetical protein